MKVWLLKMVLTSAIIKNWRKKFECWKGNVFKLYLMHEIFDYLIICIIDKFYVNNEFNEPFES